MIPLVAGARIGPAATALATPFRDGAVDTACLTRLIDRQIARGTNALVVCGSTGEAAAMRADEQAGVISLTVSTAAGRAPVIAGCGAPDTALAMELASAAARAGATALLCAPPPYSHPTQEGIVGHVRAVAHASDLPIILYDVPSRTGVRVADETVWQLFERGLIAGIKDATGDLARPPRLRALCGSELLQMSGDDATAACYRAAGGHGCISVIGNLVPALCRALHDAWDGGDLARFGATRDRLAPLADAMFVESNPIPLKAALALLELAPGDVRLPLTRATATTRERLGDVLDKVMRIEEDALLSQPVWQGVMKKLEKHFFFENHGEAALQKRGKRLLKI